MKMKGSDEEEDEEQDEVVWGVKQVWVWGGETGVGLEVRQVCVWG